MEKLRAAMAIATQPQALDMAERIDRALRQHEIRQQLQGLSRGEREGQLRAQHLDRDLAVELRDGGEVHFADPTRAEPGGDLVRIRAAGSVTASAPRRPCARPPKTSPPERRAA